MKTAWKDNRIAILVGLLSFFSAWFYNEWNLTILQKEEPQKVNAHLTLRTPDDASYLGPAKNFYENGVWKSGGLGKQSYFFRTPGYGLYRLSLMYIGGYDFSFRAAKFLQLLFFAFSGVLLYKIGRRYIGNSKLALCMSLLYGCTPFACGFLYGNITESVTPAALILFYYLLLKALDSAHRKLFYYFLSALVLSILILVRPVLGLFIFLLPLFFWKDFYHKKKVGFLLLNTTLLMVVSLSSIGIWAFRNYTIAGKIVGLQPQFFVENNSPYRPTHKAMLDFSLSFGMNITDFDAAVLPLWNAAIKGDTSEVYIQPFVEKIPLHIVQTLGKENLLQALKNYQASILWQKNYYDLNIPMPDTIPSQEQVVIKDFEQFKRSYQSHYFLESNVIVPLRILQKFACHSNLSFHIFQKTYRGQFWMEGLRGLFFLLHVSCFAGCLLSLFFIKKWDGKLLFAISILLYLFYLVYFNRLFEERYTLPVLPIMLVGLFCVFDRIILRLSQGKHRYR